MNMLRIKDKTIALPLANIAAFALMHADSDPELFRDVKAFLRDELDCVAEDRFRLIKAAIDETEKPFRPQADDDALALLALFSRSGGASRFLAADPTALYPVGCLEGRVFDGELYVTVRKTAPLVGEEGPETAFPTRFMLTDAMKETMRRLADDELYVTAADDGSACLLLHDVVASRLFHSLLDTGRRCPATIWEVYLNGDWPETPRIGEAEISMQREGVLVIRPENRILLELASIIVRGGLLSVMVYSSDIPRRTVGGREQTNAERNYYQNWRAVFAAPSLVNPRQRMPAWVSAETILNPSFVDVPVYLQVPEELAVRLMMKSRRMCPGWLDVAKVCLRNPALLKPLDGPVDG